MTLFEPDGSPGAISSPDIRSLYEDPQGRIWVGNNAGGLNLFQPDTETFRTWRSDAADPSSLVNDSVYGITMDHQGALWVGTREGLDLFDPDSGRFQRVLTPDGEPALAGDWAFAMETDAQGRIWVGTVGSGITRFSPGAGTMERFDLAAMTDGNANRNDVFELLIDHGGDTWAGTRAGLVHMDGDDDAVRSFNFVEDAEVDDTVVALAEGPDGRIWGFTLQRGLEAIDPRGCVIEPGKITGGGTINSLGGEKRAQVAFTMDACDAENVKGQFQFNDVDALGFQDLGGVKLHGDVVAGGLCIDDQDNPELTEEDQGRICNFCNPGEYEVEYEYRSTNPGAPGLGTGGLCVVDFGEGNGGDINAAAIVIVNGGPYQGYSNVGTLRGNAQSHDCKEDEEA